MDGMLPGQFQEMVLTNQGNIQSREKGLQILIDVHSVWPL